MGNNDHCFRSPGDRGSSPLILPMTLVIPTTYHEIIFVCIGNSTYQPTVEEINEIRDWVNDHMDCWPDCFPDLNNIMHQPLELKIFPECSPKYEYVFMLETDYNPTDSDIKFWTEVLSFKESEDKFTVFVFADYFDSIKRIKKHLLPFI